MARSLRLFLLEALLWLPQVQAATSDIAIVELPPEARETLRHIEQGGPFHYMLAMVRCSGTTNANCRSVITAPTITKLLNTFGSSHEFAGTTTERPNRGGQLCAWLQRG